MQDYWQSRKTLSYYQQAIDWARQYTPAGGSILDVGGGVSMGCRYLEALDGYDRTSVETQHGDSTLPGVRLILSRFEDWQADKLYDTVLCLQCVEHVDNPYLFCRKLACAGKVVILSVPFEWPSGLEKDHIHDPIGREKLERWMLRQPHQDLVLGDKPWQRLIGLYL